MNDSNYFGFKPAVENFHTFLEGGQSILVHKEQMEQIKIEAHYQAAPIDIQPCLLMPVSGEGRNQVVERIYKITRLSPDVDPANHVFATKARRCYKMVGDDHPLIFSKGPGTDRAFRNGVVANMVGGNLANHKATNSIACMVYDYGLDTMYLAFVVKVLPPQ